MNKNSQYINQVNVNISEMARLTFNEVVNDETIQVVALSMHVEFLKVMLQAIGGALDNHSQNIASIKSDRNVN